MIATNRDTLRFSLTCQCCTINVCHVLIGSICQALCLMSDKTEFQTTSMMSFKVHYRNIVFFIDPVQAKLKFASMLICVFCFNGITNLQKHLSFSGWPHLKCLLPSSSFIYFPVMISDPPVPEPPPSADTAKHLAESFFFFLSRIFPGMFLHFWTTLVLYRSREQPWLLLSFVSYHSVITRARGSHLIVTGWRFVLVVMG